MQSQQPHMSLFVGGYCHVTHSLGVFKSMVELGRMSRILYAIRQILLRRVV